MARGVKVSEATREKIIAAHNTGESKGAIAKLFKLSKSTVCGIINKYEKEKPDEVEQVRTQKKIEYIEEASNVVKGLLAVLERRVATILKDEDVLEEIIDIISDSDLTDRSKNSLIGKMSSIMSPKLTELTTAFGTIYDKLEKIKLDAPDANGGGVIEITEVNPLERPEVTGDE